MLKMVKMAGSIANLAVIVVDEVVLCHEQNDLIVTTTVIHVLKAVVITVELAHVTFLGHDTDIRVD